MKNEGTSEMGLFDHLRELRKRLIIAIVAVAVGAIVAYSYSASIFIYINKPFVEAFSSEVVGLGPAEAFTIRVKVSLFAGALFMSPVLFWQLWLFIAPGLYDKEKKMVIPFVAISTLLFLSGVWLCYSAILPLAYQFFHDQYKEIGLQATVRISEHLSTVVTTLLGFGAVFELPVVCYFLGRLGLIDHHTLIGGARYAVVLIFIVSAVLTPPDVLSQILMAVPLLLLYAVSIFVVKFTADRGQSLDS